MPFSRLIALLGAFLLLVLIAPAAALADTVPGPQSTLALPSDQVWAAIAGALAPAAAYVLNYLGPHISEKVKAVVHVIVAAIAGGLTQAIAGGTVGFNHTTLQLVFTAVVAALFAHKIFYLPSGISTALGGGRNAQDSPAR